VPEDDEIEGSPSRLIRAAADAATVLAGARLGGVAGAIVAAAATPYTEEFLRMALAEFKPDVQQRVAQMLGASAEASDRDPDELADLISSSERTRLLTTTAMFAAAGTAWPPKVYALGRALADGLFAADDTEINLADLVIPAMTDMERPHLSLLELLVRWIPVETVGSPIMLRAAEDLRLDSGGGTSYIGGRTWTAHQIGQARPTLRPALTSLIGTLQRHGLADQNDDTPSVLTKFYDEMSRETSTISKASMSRLTPPSSWSPTELGERVLGYYHLAAEEFEAPPTLPSGGD